MGRCDRSRRERDKLVTPDVATGENHGSDDQSPTPRKSPAFFPYEGPPKPLPIPRHGMGLRPATGFQGSWHGYLAFEGNLPDLHDS